ncbi:MAG: hypothetical protein EHM28_05945 [Spirochaetaceae bacterium]|nr:MAG: hypothetical protein EHM28_05945 [Spirochaetaceae bacterium]
MLQQLVNSGSGMKVILGPEKHTILGKSWTYVEISDDKFKGTIAILTYKEKIYVIISVINPSELEADATEIFDKFLSTLSIASLK